MRLGRVDLIFNISKTEKSIGDIFEIEFSEILPEFEYNGVVYNFSDPISFIGRYYPLKEDISVTGKIKAKLLSKCDRCLCDVKFNIDVDFNEKYSRNTEDEDIYLFEGYEIDLSKAILDIIVLNFPLFIYCKPDCKGLCFHCGIDLNKEKCNCDEENLKENSPFNILGDLFKHDKEV